MKKLILTALCLLCLSCAAFAECALPALEEYLVPIDSLGGLTFQPLSESPNMVSEIQTFAIAPNGQIAVWSRTKQGKRLLILNADGEKQGEYLLDYAPHNGQKRMLFYAADSRLCFAADAKGSSDPVFVLNPETGALEERYELPSLDLLKPYACMRSDFSGFTYSERYDSIYELVDHTNSTITVKRRRTESDPFVIYDETEKVERYEREEARAQRIYLFTVLLPTLILLALMTWGLIWIRKKNGEPIFRGFWK